MVVGCEGGVGALAFTLKPGQIEKSKILTTQHKNQSFTNNYKTVVLFQRNTKYTFKVSLNNFCFLCATYLIKKQKQT